MLLDMSENKKSKSNQAPQVDVETSILPPKVQGLLAQTVANYASFCELTIT